MINLRTLEVASEGHLSWYSAYCPIVCFEKEFLNPISESFHVPLPIAFRGFGRNPSARRQSPLKGTFFRDRLRLLKCLCEGVQKRNPGQRENKQFEGKHRTFTSARTTNLVVTQHRGAVW